MCAEVHVVTDGKLRTRWRESVANACARVRDLRDRDLTASIRVIPALDDLVLQAALADGRTATRRIDNPEALMPAFEALLSLPPTSSARTQTDDLEATAASAPEHAGRLAPAAAGTAPRLGIGPGPRVSVSESPRRAVGVELGGGSGLRVSGARFYVLVNVEGFAALSIRDWLFGLGLRGDTLALRTFASLEDFEMYALSGTMFVAKRFHPRFGQLELGIFPRIVWETQSAEVAEQDVSGSKTDIRVGAFGRMSFGASTPRFYLGFDGELSPHRFVDQSRIDPAFPALPSWSVGFGAGVVWSQN